jgi:ubiquinone/menaquinone biosynthesis C-methylase UbiE
MSTYVLMKILESMPHRYDRGINLLTAGRVKSACDRLAAYIGSGQRVLDVGCGTGALTIRAARRGAQVKGIDVNPGMLDIAKRHLEDEHLSSLVTLEERGVAELGSEPAESYDIVMSSLCFSELTDDELAFTLRELGRILKPGGLLLIADEVRPDSMAKRILFRLIRLPLVIITYLLTQTTTHAIKNLPGKIIRAGFLIVSKRLSPLGSFIEIIGQKPEGGR